MTTIHAISIYGLAIALSIGASAFAEETKTEKVEAAANRAADNTKKTYRKLKDKACETIDGKLECDRKKIENHAKNVSDKVKSDVKELKNKID